MTRKNITLLIICLIVILGAWYFMQQQNTPPRANSNQPLPIASSTSIPSSVSYKCQPGKTAYDLLLQNYPAVQTKDTSFGKQVIAIAGLSQTTNKFWLYSVDDKEATIGAQQYFCQNQEEIKWELK